MRCSIIQTHMYIQSTEETCVNIYSFIFFKLNTLIKRCWVEIQGGEVWSGLCLEAKGLIFPVSCCLLLLSAAGGHMVAAVS